MRAGERFESGKFYSGFLEGFDVLLEEVPLAAYDEYLRWDIAFYGGTDFKVLQIIYPTTKGVWPWANAASESFKKWQPILARIGLA